MEKYIKHIAGSFDETNMQLCKICGCVLLDYEGVFWIGDQSPGGFTEDADVFVSKDGSFRTRHIHESESFVNCNEV
jgi:hypothetical protein